MKLNSCRAAAHLLVVCAETPPTAHRQASGLGAVTTHEMLDLPRGPPATLHYSTQTAGQV